jgi:dTDP-4-dehydrorhamnose reductase
MKMLEKILITGAFGLVGKYILPILQTDYSVYATSHLSSVNSLHITIADLSNKKTAEELLNKIRPNIVINLAAMTDVDTCETQRELAKRVNCDFVSILADYLRLNEAFLLHVSTDYIFSGEKGNYKENDTPIPINWYGQTKLCAEKEIITKVPKERWCIARTSSVFGFHAHKQTFPLYIIDRLKQGEKVRAIEDQYTNPTYGKDLAEMIREVIKRRIPGIIHLAGASRLSRYQQAEMITKVFKFDIDLVQRIKLEDMHYSAKRPQDSSLDITEAAELLFNKPREFSSSLRSFKGELISQNYMLGSD